MTPCLAKALAIAAPMPSLAPVTIATLPFHLPIESTMVSLRSFTVENDFAAAAFSSIYMIGGWWEKIVDYSNEACSSY